MNKLESELKEIKKMKGGEGEGESASGLDTQVDKGKIECSKECKVKINGKQKVVKSHRVISNGVEGIERLLRMCRNDEAKKSKVFEGWKEMHRCMDKFMKEMEDVTGSVVDVINNDG